MSQVVSIVGPTGVGKSRLALQIAQAFNGEIVSADSRQVYRYMDIGTAKPTSEEQALVPHHLIDIVDPGQEFSLAQYQKLAYRTIEDIENRGKLPILAGGSGLYVWTVLEGWQIPAVAPDTTLRIALEKKAAELGHDKLYQELVDLDPVAAQHIDPRNVRRVIRALEVHQTGALPPAKKAPPFNTLIIGLTANRDELYRRTDERVDEMIKNGLVEEVKKLLETGYNLDLPAMSGIGYKQIGLFMKENLTLEDAIFQIKTETHRLVRHQYNWFRLNDQRIRWFDVNKSTEREIISLVEEFTGQNIS